MLFAKYSLLLRSSYKAKITDFNVITNNKLLFACDMKHLHIITPVKDSIESTLETVKAVLTSDIKVPYTYTIYNDFSTDENTALLGKYSKELGFELVNLRDLTDHPSPNYLLVLQMTREESIKKDWGLAIVESDVIVKKDTFQKLYEGAAADEKCAIAASVTVDEKGLVTSLKPGKTKIILTSVDDERVTHEINVSVEGTLATKRKAEEVMRRVRKNMKLDYFE